MFLLQTSGDSARLTRSTPGTLWLFMDCTARLSPCPPPCPCSSAWRHQRACRPSHKPWTCQPAHAAAPGPVGIEVRHAQKGFSLQLRSCSNNPVGGKPKGKRTTARGNHLELTMCMIACTHTVPCIFVTCSIVALRFLLCLSASCLCPSTAADRLGRPGMSQGLQPCAGCGRPGAAAGAGACAWPLSAAGQQRQGARGCARDGKRAERGEGAVSGAQKQMNRVRTDQQNCILPMGVWGGMPVGK